MSLQNEGRTTQSYLASCFLEQKASLQAPRYQSDRISRTSSVLAPGGIGFSSSVSRNYNDNDDSDHDLKA